jgi:hypothetical protein
MERRAYWGGIGRQQQLAHALYICLFSLAARLDFCGSFFFFFFFVSSSITKMLPCLFNACITCPLRFDHGADCFTIISPSKEQGMGGLSRHDASTQVSDGHHICWMNSLLW